jgi:hypothetical protein
VTRAGTGKTRSTHSQALETEYTFEPLRKSKTENQRSTTMTTTTPEATVEASVLTAYLKPLVDKHTANELIKYEDLIQSNTSALLELKKHSSTPVGNAVRDKLRALHHEQVELYKAAAVEHLKAWADEAKPVDALPNWKFVPKSVLDAARQRVAERAAAAAAAAGTAAGVILTAEESTTAATIVNDAVKNDAIEMEEGEEEGEVDGSSEQEDAEGAGFGSETVDNSTTEIIAVDEDPPEQEEKPSKPEGKASVTAEKGSKGGILAKRHAARAGSKAGGGGGGPAKKKQPPPAKSPAPGGKRQPRPPARKPRAAPTK